MADDAASSAAGIALPLSPSLLRSGALSLLTSALPLVVALAALPLLTRQLGTERLGLLALAWAWLGYAALLDLGLGRALTRIIAAADAGEAVEISITSSYVTAHRALTVIGLVVGVVGATLAPWYVSSVIDVSEALQGDAVLSAIVFALTVPAITGASAPRAVLEARQQFRAVNLVRLPVGVGTFALPVMLLPFTASLTVIALCLALVRLWAWSRYIVLANRELPRAGGEEASLQNLRPLLKAGAWMTISNVISPLMTFADRFLIGSMISLSAVALYAVPWEAVTKLWIVPGALTMVLFPMIARATTNDRMQLVTLHTLGVRLVAAIVIPVCAIAALLAPWLLQFVGGAQYRAESVTVLQILAVGIAANCIAAVPFTMLQASGRSRWTAMLHLIELIPFVITLWFAITHWGIVGAAITWTGRVVLDWVLMLWRAQAFAPLPQSGIFMSVTGVALVACCATVSAVSPLNSAALIVISAILATAIPVAIWSQRSAAERSVLLRVEGRR
jgi:O-antigen/teichoic acid export membrane protein